MYFRLICMKNWNDWITPRLRPERHVVFSGHLLAADAVVRMPHNNTLHLTAIALCSIAAGELRRSAPVFQGDVTML
jgi:hypothetical protein